MENPITQILKTMHQYMKMTSQENTLSQNGTEWHKRAEVVGRRPLRNILTEKPGFALGLRSQSISELFYIIFDEILDASVRYTNIAGCRLGHERILYGRRPAGKRLKHSLVFIF